ncbi:hypothetical protein WOLCODRAFT_67587 [Wolfiporia cocos MD-104 SS10]|uniref:Uncharacterized protein n=1 Tax=Wolfiporia cocos (strain MD-104) TaxID=742152 RepID=A0A2H3JMW1_WOLCO|nr:hypothetical protein WOLCODRAFT_67587 [Wolfiporia cocos MD-104 SS10]
MHSTLFASGIMIHSIVLLISQVDQPSGAIWAKFDPLMPQPWAAYFLQAAASLSALAVTYYWDAATKGVLASTSAAVCILLVGLSSGKTPFVLVGGCLLTISASFLYLAHHTDIEDDARHGKRAAIPFRRLVSAVLLVSSLFYLVLGASHEWGRVLDHSEKPATVSEVLDEATASCHRRPLASLEYWPVERTYHAFDNVLLIVFFSHARYDANLDYYKEVYSQFFPNIVFVGPGSREDKGFAHSYDVVVDSYQSDEDLNDPTFYKMAGRMAHHMLFTVMRENDCYDGYLWAPFDTLLNVPRLQQFDQNLFWYHSPFGQYVPNPAFSDMAANMNKSRHAPPANLSPDPTVDLTATWRGWGPDWCDPHVGLAIWAAGMEVDTFHTFHWGDRGADGVWRGNFDHIADVRSLLVESAQMQGVEWPV